MRRAASWVVVLALLGFAAAETYHYLRWNFDDAYIAFRMATNLAHGQGWSFNPGEAHNASTSVLNTFLLGVAARVFPDVPTAGHLLGSLWLIVLTLVVARLFWERFGPWQALGAGAAILWVLATNATWAIEIHLFFCLFVLFVWAEQRGWNSWALVGLLVLARPDALIVAGLRWVKTLITERRLSIGGVGIFLLVLSPWVIYSLVHFHQILPATLSAKMWQGRSGFWGTGWIYMKGLVSHLVLTGPVRLTIGLLGLPGIYFFLRDRSPFLYLIGFAAIQQAVYTVLNVPPYHWYFSVLDGALTLASCYGVASVYELVMTRAQVRAKTREICSVALFVVVLAVTAVQVQAAFAIQVHDVRDQGYRSVVARLRQANLPPGPIATIEVGTFGYLLDRPMLDLSGLTSPNPEFITGEHSDRFFAAPPPTVLFHEPIWTFERALYDDVRFKMMYGPAVPVRDTQTPMQYFVLRPGAHAPSQEEIAAFVRQEYSAFQLQTAGPLAALQPSAQPLCVLDQINGQTAAAKPFDLPRTVLVLTGWAVDQTSGELQPDLYAVLSAGDRRYAMKAPRVSRPDVAVHLHDPRYEMAGFDLQGGLADVPPGRYRVGIAQPQREGVLYCEFPNVITLGQ